MDPDLPGGPENRDPGLARERTELAWTRTAISFAALGAAMLRTTAAAGAVVLAVAAGVWGLGQLSARDVSLAARRGPSDHRRTLALITSATVLVAVVALGFALFAPDHIRP